MSINKLSESLLNKLNDVVKLELNQIVELVSTYSDEELIQFGYYYLEDGFEKDSHRVKTEMNLSMDDEIELKDWYISLIEDSTNTERGM
jgi:hypothetical protein|tara:strand:+ start:670 stop:936 length:267 start_codon:yes stop_codon:yes gene_type:complete